MRREAGREQGDQQSKKRKKGNFGAEKSFKEQQKGTKKKEKN